ncbi:DUF1294 domain-containing protein [Neptuniibacter sp.]|uniref:DUF1294 domain-containing protein n=1 Tax=Neptuniibacter sp. TaxID=1962643 RepID=UPI00261A25B3|nr:DUF1294 domain-containing protein [Neptuniibacter sp.]MCP4597079.1 DUF1294 domain-containing protein [Neptuniibacter sp.]
MRTKGKIISWNDEKGFGFVEPCSGGKRVFLHIKAFRQRSSRPEIGKLVTYSLSTDRQGRPCAAKATLAGDRLPQQTKSQNNSLALICAAIFLTVVCISVITAKIHPLILALYIVASLLTFLIYAMDKSAARKGGWRTQESTLHMFALIGGWPGALLAQQKLRHKSKKQPFRFVFWITVLLNCSAFIWLYTPSGSSTAQALIALIA